MRIQGYEIFGFNVRHITHLYYTVKIEYYTIVKHADCDNYFWHCVEVRYKDWKSRKHINLIRMIQNDYSIQHFCDICEGAVVLDSELERLKAKPVDLSKIHIIGV